MKTRIFALDQSHLSRWRGSSLTLVLGVGLCMAMAYGHAMAQTNQARGIETSPDLEANSELADYLKYAALHNPELERAFHQWRVAVEEIARSRSLPDPKLNYGYYLQEVETRVGPQRHRIGLSQSIPWFGKLDLREDMAAAEAAARYQEFQAARLRLFYQVKDIWYELYYLGKSLAITEDNLRLLEHLEGVAQAKYKSGGPLTGVAKAQVEMGKLSERLSNLKDQKSPLIARLNAYLDRDSEAPVSLPGQVLISSHQVDEKRLTGWLQSSNPEMLGLSSLITREENALALARKEVYPDFNFGVDYIQTDRRRADVPDNGKDAVVAMVSVNIPLWVGRNRAGIRKAEARREAVTQSRAARFNLLEADLRMAAFRYRDAERKIDLYRDTLRPLAEKSMNVAQQAWETGRADFLDLIDAQRLLLQFQLEEERAIADREQRVAEIEMILGRELDSVNAADKSGEALGEKDETLKETRP